MGSLDRIKPDFMDATETIEPVNLVTSSGRLVSLPAQKICLLRPIPPVWHGGSCDGAMYRKSCRRQHTFLCASERVKTVAITVQRTIQST